MTRAEVGQVQFGATLIAFTIIRSRRRQKTVEIILDPADGVLVAAPTNTSAEDIRAIVRRRAPWIMRKSSEARLQPRRKEYVSGETLPYLGRQARLFVELAEVKRVVVQFEHWRFQVTVPLDLPGDEQRQAVEAALTRWYRDQALRVFCTRVEHWSTRLGIRPQAVLMRNERQRWGSCSIDGTIRFNWRTVMLQPSLIDYVIVHELAHLVTRNHSSQFWIKVGETLPDFKIRRARLREAGADLVL